MKAAQTIYLPTPLSEPPIESGQYFLLSSTAIIGEGKFELNTGLWTCDWWSSQELTHWLKLVTGYFLTEHEYIETMAAD